jgi:hypothetical protein
MEDGGGGRGTEVRVEVGLSLELAAEPQQESCDKQSLSLNL